MRYFITSVLLFLFIDISAQDIVQDTSMTDVVLPSITITSTKEEKNIEDTPLPINIITSKEIQSAGSSRLDDIINKEVGITTVSTLTGSEGVQVQGLDASYTTILIDGCPLIGRSFGVLDLQRISVLNVDRIEFLQGASSSLYGSDALAGVINIITEEQEEEGHSMNLAMRLSSYNTLNPNIIYKNKSSKLQSMYSIDYYKTDGYDLISDDMLNTVNPYYNYTLYSKHKYDISNKLSLSNSLRYYGQNQINTALKEDSLLEGESLIKEWNLFSSFKYSISNSIIQYLDVYATNYRADEFLRYKDDKLFDDNYFNHTLFKPELRTAISIRKMNITSGVGFSKDILDRKDFVDIHSQELIFTYAQLDGKIGGIDIIAGSRYDNYLDVESNLSHKFALGFPVLSNIKLNTSVGTGFKVPDFRQRFFDFTNSTIGYTVLGRDVAFDRLTSMQEQGMLLNTIIPIDSLSSSLTYESSMNLNIGLIYLASKYLTLDMNFFNNRIDNLIEAQLVANKTNSLPVFSYFNVNQVVTSGLKMNIGFDNDIIDIKLGYQFLSAFDPDVKDKFKNGEIYARDNETLSSFQLSDDDYVGLFNRSKHMISLRGVYDYKDIAKLNLSLSYRSKYATIDANANQVLDVYDDFIDGYILSDIGLSYQIRENINLQIGINNLFDYSNPEYISNISGRTYYLNGVINIF